MPQQSPFAPAISGLIGQRRRIGSIATPSMGEGQFYEDPSITAHGLLKQQEDEIQNRSYAETDPAALQRLARILQGNQVDLSENEASMQNPEMEAGYAANEAARRVGFPSSAAQGAYDRSQSEAKMNVPIDQIEAQNRGAFSRLLQTGMDSRQLQQEGQELIGEREEAAHQRALEFGNQMGGASGRSFGYTAPGKTTGGRVSIGAAPRPINTDRDLAAIRAELGRLEVGGSRDPGSLAVLNSAAASFMTKSGVDPRNQQRIMDILINSQSGDELLSSDELVEPDPNDPPMSQEDLINLINILRQIRGK